MSRNIRKLFDKHIEKDDLVLPCEEKHFTLKVILRPVTSLRSLFERLIRKGIGAEAAMEIIFVFIVCQLDFSVSTHFITGPNKNVCMFTSTPFSSEREAKTLLNLKHGLLDLFSKKIFPDYDFSSYHSELLGYPNGEKHKEINKYLIAAHEDSVINLLITDEYLYFKNNNKSFSGRLMLNNQINL